MKCPNCGSENPENGNFCCECGTTLPHDKDCPKCQCRVPLEAKFCFNCGYSFSGSTASRAMNVSGVSLGDKNAIAGDIIGKKQEYKISGNTTIIQNSDETRKTEKCHICGNISLKINGYVCPECGEFTCRKCFDINAGKCTTCSTSGLKNHEEQYKSKAKEFLLNDNRIDAAEYRQLTVLAKNLGIDDSRAAELLEQVKNANGTSSLTSFEKIHLEKSMELYYGEGKPNTCDLLEPIYDTHPHEEELLNVYLPILGWTNPDKAKKIISGLTFDCEGADAAVFRMALKEKDFATAEKTIKRACKKWPQSFLFKCLKIEYYLNLFRQFKTQDWLDKAENELSCLGEGRTKLERSFKVRVVNHFVLLAGKPDSQPDKKFCKQNDIYYSITLPNI